MATQMPLVAGRTPFFRVFMKNLVSVIPPKREHVWRNGRTSYVLKLICIGNNKLCFIFYLISIIQYYLRNVVIQRPEVEKNQFCPHGQNHISSEGRPDCRFHVAITIPVEKTHDETNHHSNHIWLDARFLAVFCIMFRKVSQESMVKHNIIYIAIVIMNRAWVENSGDM